LEWCAEETEEITHQADIVEEAKEMLKGWEGSEG
jgi:hypothetical protein